MAISAGKLERATQDLFGETTGVAIPRLMIELRTPYLVAVTLGVYPNTVRNWLIKHGWSVQDGVWTAPQPEPDHA